jgi:hypothetical protein
MEVILKASNGDRKKNLENIATAVQLLLSEATSVSGRATLNENQIHKISGWMEQLRIIADEWEVMDKKLKAVESYFTQINFQDSIGLKIKEVILKKIKE